MGHAIPAAPGVHPDLATRTGGDIAWLASGTAALSLAIRLAMRETNRRRVVLPAYGCPDLVAATVAAQGEPVLVDTPGGSPFLDPDLVEGPAQDAAAIVGVHFLGLRQDLRPLALAAAEAGAVLIEDSAQYLPWPDDDGPVGDLRIFSFGRGKPAGALGGGALAFGPGWRGRVPGRYELDPGRVANAARLPAGLRARGALYNLLIQPRWYGLVSRLPGTGLGLTRYRPLASLDPLDPGRALIADRLVRSRARARSLAQQAIESGLRELSGPVDDLAVRMGNERALLRYPVLLADRQKRDAALRRLGAAGLGATAMYGAALADLPEMPRVETAGTGRARDFAKRLITLPVHEDVTPAHVDRMMAILAAVA